jgi:tRNA modification GTPase
VISSGDTIFAPASGYGRSGICVVRLSGPRARFVLEAMAGGAPPPRQLALRRLRHPRSGEGLDEGLVAWMPGPRSFTGEDQAELHVHGGAAVRAAVLAALGEIDACRPAEAGEFTRRAFLNGRMDLSEVEGLADLIEAETEAQRRQALRQLDGRLGTLVEGWRERLIDILATLEASLDFADEGDVAVEIEQHAMVDIAALTAELAGHLDDHHRGERLRDGFVVVLAGAPNAGKSTLLNALARRDVAIVSPTPGTTRDAIEVRCDLGGLPVTFVDTAGICETQDEIEQKGIARTRARASTADLILWLEAPGSAGEAHDLGAAPVFRVGTKLDLDANSVATGAAMRISAKTGAGMDELLGRIAESAGAALGHGDALITRARHRGALERARASLHRASHALETPRVELGAEDVRLALRSLGEITGRVNVENVLDRLFSTFCIGK